MSFFAPREQPRQPGLLHIGYVLGSTASEALVAYTTSQVLPAGLPLPAGARLFTADEAYRLNQSRPFVLCLDLSAKLPLTKAWFPNVDGADQGIIAIAANRLQEELTDLAMNLLRRRRDVIQMRGV